jgi:uncharacterized repeat protein (TIGR04138 family)|tara:strand:- start:2669 stop:3103 length:435 start_codon:yes stop_codon:yes gene_type:complete
MQAFDYNEVLDQILDKDDRYHRDAYYFIREGLDSTQHKLAKDAGGNEPRHISGQELTNGLRQYAIDNYGPMTKTLLNEWGVNSTEDFGEIVFNLVENNLLAKTENDSREDFANGFDFNEAFVVPYQVLTKQCSDGKVQANPNQN